MLIDGADAFRAIYEAILAANVRCTSQLARQPGLSAVRDEGAPALRDLLAETCRARRGTPAAVGRPAAARLPTDAARSSAMPGRVHPRTHGALRARQPRADDALPPREDRHRRRRGGLRRRHRPHRARGRPLRHTSTTVARGAAAGTTSHRGSGPGRRATSPSTSATAGASHRRGAARPRRAPAPAGESRSRSSAPSPSDLRLRARSGDFTDPRGVRSRAARQRSGSIYLENQFLWSPEIVDAARGQARDPPTTSFRILLLLPRKPNNGARHHPRPARPARGSRRRRQRLLATHDRRPAGRVVAAGLCARQGRHRRRPLAHDRVDQPQRALAVQRLRAQHRHLRRGPRPRDALRLWAEHPERTETRSPAPHTR